MLTKKQGFPQENELVLCTVTKIHFHSVFVNIDEYGRSGMVHISEISAGRIRNIKDYVTEGKVVVCKVLRIDKARGHIDLSLRRVNESQRRAKVDEIKQQQIAEKIVIFVAEQLKEDTKKFYSEISEKILAKFDTIYECFEEIVNEDYDLAKLKIEPAVAKELKKIVLQRIKPAEVEIKGFFELKSYEPDGVDIVKTALKKGVDKLNDKSSITYAGGGKYNVVIRSQDYKDAEKILEKMNKAVDTYMEKHGSVAKFTRDQK